jgi:REP element-mobilizing transposase RayT
LYYVTSRGGDGQRLLFRDHDDHLAYLALLFEYKQRYGVQLFAYCLLPDQVHLCLELGPKSNISGLMHDVTSRYTKYSNRRYNREGHLFQERFRTVLMEKHALILPMTAYVHSLPARVGLSREFNTYPYSSCAAYLNAESHQSAKEISEEVSEVLAHLPGGYETFLNRIEPAAMNQLEQRLSQRILGSEAFVAAIRSRIKAAQGLPASEPPVAASKRAQASAPIARRFAWRPARVAWASGVAAMLLVAAIGVQQRIGTLEQVLASLSKENEALFKARGVFASFEENQASLRTHAALAVQHEAIGELVSLEGTEWDVRLMPMHAKTPEAIQQDQLAFTRRQVSSTALASQGFSAANYTTTEQPDGTLNWETMQSNPSGELVSWQGAWQGPVMRGVVTRQTTGKTPEHFTFVAVTRKPAAIRSET